MPTAAGVKPSPSVGASIRPLPHGIYAGEVVRIDEAARQMIFRITDSCGSPRAGTWSVPLDHAIFRANSQPESAQGHTDEVTLREWEDLAAMRKSWEVHYTPSELTIGDGPSAWCDGG
jgi:hypothetical protein